MGPLRPAAVDRRCRRHPGRNPHQRRRAAPRPACRPEHPAARSRPRPGRRPRHQGHHRQHRYHNQQYKALAEELGLAVDHDQRIGWSLTTVPDSTAGIYAQWLVRLRVAMTLWRRAEHEGATSTGNGNGNGDGTRASGLIAAACPCGRSIRIAATTLAAAPVICGACGGGFTLKGRRVDT